MGRATGGLRGPGISLSRNHSSSKHLRIPHTNAVRITPQKDYCSWSYFHPHLPHLCRPAITPAFQALANVSVSSSGALRYRTDWLCTEEVHHAG
jgi:hypothetical protein